MKEFLQEHKYIDYQCDNIQAKATELFTADMTDTKKVEVAFKFVRDEIFHSFDHEPTHITTKASDVLHYKTGICHAKANLLTALLRSQGIPTGFCFQRLTLLDDDSLGYCVHAYNAVYLSNKWIKLDARGNKQGVDAQFSMDTPVLAFQNRGEYDEYFFKGIYAKPHQASMDMLENANSVQDILDNIPSYITEEATIVEN